MPKTKQTVSHWGLPFFTIWTGQALSLLGSRMAAFALVWWLTETTGSATILATTSIAAWLPGVVLGPFAGALIDRWNRRVVMMVSDTIVALGSAWLVYLFWTDSIQVWHVYLVTLVNSIGGTFQGYAMMTSTSLMVPEQHMARVQGANQTLQGALDIAGPPLGALLLAVLPLHKIMGLDVATAALAIFPLFFIPVPQPPKTEQTDATPKLSLWADVLVGMRYIWRWPGLLGILCLGAFMNFIHNPTIALLPILVVDHFGGEALQLGWLQAALGIGIVVGGVILSLWGGFRRRVLSILMGDIGAGLGILLIGLAPQEALWLAWVGMFIGGVMSAFINGPLIAMMQTTVAPELQGRVFSLFGSGLKVTTLLGLAIAGPLTDLIGVRTWFIVGGFCIFLIAPVMFFIPVIVNIEDQQSGEKSVQADVSTPSAS